MTERIEPTAPDFSNCEFISPRHLSATLDLSRAYCRNRRLEGTWVEGIHWVRLNSRTTRYNLPLIRDWLQNRQYPAVHQRAIDRYQESLLSNQRAKRKPKSQTA